MLAMRVLLNVRSSQFGLALLVALLWGSVNPVTAQTTPAPQGGEAAAIARERQEAQVLLDQLKQERNVQLQVKAEAERQFKNATLLFTVFLIILGVIIAAAIVMLWLLRRAVIREVAEVVQSRLGELKTLKVQVANAQSQIDGVLAQADGMRSDLNVELAKVQSIATLKQESIQALVNDLTKKQQQALKSLQVQMESSQVTLQQTESSYALKAQFLLNELQQQQSDYTSDLQGFQDSFGKRLNTLAGEAQAENQRIMTQLHHRSSNCRMLRNSTAIALSRV
jgi:uncharacterized protein YoxC